MDEPEIEDILREINRWVWTIGYTGHSPERLKAHMRNMHVFDVQDAQGQGRQSTRKPATTSTGDYFGLPWPCYGTPELKHPGIAQPLRHLASTSWTAAATSAPTSASRRTASTCWPRTARTRMGADLTTGYPEFDHVLLKKLGWWDELTEAEKAKAEGKNWKTDSVGRHHPRRDEEPRLPPLRQRQGARGGLELPRPDPAAPRAALLDPPRPDRQVPDARRQEGLLAPAHPLQVGAGEEPRTCCTRTSR